MSRFIVVSHSRDETVFLRIVDHGRAGVRYGLARNMADATTFRDATKAGMKAGRASAYIMRLFETVEVEKARTLENVG